MDRKEGDCCAPFAGAGTPSSTMCPGLRSTSVPSGIFIYPAIWPQQTWAKNWVGWVCPFSGGSWIHIEHNVGPRPTSVPSGILIHASVGPQQTWAENWVGLFPFWGRGLGPLHLFWGRRLGPHLTQSRLGWGLPPYQVVSWCIQPFGHNEDGPKIGGSAPFGEGKNLHKEKLCLAVIYRGAKFRDDTTTFTNIKANIFKTEKGKKDSIGQDRKKVTKGLYFTYLVRSPHWSDLHRKLCSKWPCQCNHMCQVSKWNFPFSYWFLNVPYNSAALLHCLWYSGLQRSQ